MQYIIVSWLCVSLLGTVAEEICNTKEDCDTDHTSLLQTYASLNKHSATPEALNSGDKSSHNKVQDEPDRAVQVTFRNAGDKRNSSALIMNAMKEAGAELGEWQPVSVDVHNHSLGTEEDSFPFVWDFMVRRVPSPRELQYGESEDESLEEIEEEFLPSESPPPSESHINAALLEVEVVDVNFDPDFDSHTNVSLLEVSRKSKAKNSKQKKWVKDAMAKLQGEVCERPGSYRASSRLVLNMGGFLQEDCTHREWRTERSIFPGHAECVVNCDDDTMGYPSYTGGKTCSYNCQKPGLEHIGDDCLNDYCSVDTGACIHKVAKIALAAFDVLSNLFPPFKSVAAVSKAVRSGSKIAIKIALKAAAKTVAKKLLKKAKANLKKHMKMIKKELKDEATEEAIIEAGAELFALEGALVQDATAEFKDQALELVEAVDPTGIADLVNALQTDSCDSKTIPDMPLDGLEDEQSYEPCVDCWCSGNTGGYWGTYYWCQLEYTGMYKEKCSVSGEVYTYRGHACPAPKCTACTCSTNTGGYWGTYGSCTAPHHNAGMRYHKFCMEQYGEYSYKGHSCR